MRAAGLAFFLCAFAAFAQFPFPGQTPYPGGGPNGGSGGNRRNRQQQPEDKRSDSKSSSASSSSADGILRRASSSQVVLETPDHRIVWFRINGKTTTTKDGKDADAKDFQLADHISVDYTADDDGIYYAGAITWNGAGSAEEKAGAARTTDLPRAEMSTAEQARKTTPSSSRGDDDRPILRRGNKSDDSAAAQPKPDPGAPPAAPAPPPQQTAQAEPEDGRAVTQVKPPDAPRDADDPGRPKLRRGEPIKVNPPQPPPVVAANRPTPQEPPKAPAGAPQAIPIQEDPAIAKAREVAFQFAERLPNFFCQQVTTRYRTEDAKRGWDPIDIVSADLAYEDGSETYKNIKIGNKAVNKSMDDIGGATSTGEFSSELLAIMDPASDATFRRDGSDTIAGRAALVYKYEVPREHSTWRVEGPSQLYYPAYRGSVWIDKETSRVLRIEQEGRNMPLGFVFDTVETSVDYDYIRLGTPDQYLMPVDADMLSCIRGTSFCSRNRIEFRNYRKFDAASSIKFGTVDDK